MYVSAQRFPPPERKLLRRKSPGATRVPIYFGCKGTYMNDFNLLRRGLSWCAMALLATLAAGCNGDSILGAGGRVAPAPLAPAVTLVTPADNAISVPVTSAVAI